jgi:hypothetical protein
MTLKINDQNIKKILWNFIKSSKFNEISRLIIKDETEQSYYNINEIMVIMIDNDYIINHYYDYKIQETNLRSQDFYRIDLEKSEAIKVDDFGKKQEFLNVFMKNTINKILFYYDMDDVYKESEKVMKMMKNINEYKWNL